MDAMMEANKKKANRNALLGIADKQDKGKDHKKNDKNKKKNTKKFLQLFKKAS